MSYEDIKVIFKVMCSLVKQNLLVGLGVGKWFYSSTMLEFDQAMIMESVFSFLPSYFSIIFLGKGKISKSVSLFLSHIRPKWFWSIRLQDFKLNIPDTLVQN